MNLVALPAFFDNDISMLHDSICAPAVDPAETPPVAAALDAQGLELPGILVTHHPAYRAGGVNALREHLHRRCAAVVAALRE